MILVRVPSQHSSSYRRLFPIFVLILTLVLVLRPSSDFYRQVRGLPPVAPRRGRVDKIADFQKLHVEPGDKVQPLDWTGGVVHAMLLSRVEIATPFIYDFHFYHHISNPYIQTLRKRFMQKLKEAAPRYVIEIVHRYKPWVSGLDTTRNFKKLGRLLNADYLVRIKGNGYVIYERTRKKAKVVNQ